MRRHLTIALAAAVALTPFASASAALKVGDRAPDFTTTAALAGKPFRFNLHEALKKGPVVLYFFPAAFTTGCTIEAHEFSAASWDFHKMGATLIGMSADGIDKLEKFSTLECRDAFAVGTASPKTITGYDVPLKQKAGLTDRTSYVIGRNGRIAFVYSSPEPAGHVTGTMDAVKKLTGKN
jgi:thioredoxin-dependent peroxiredoxin